MVIQGSGQQDSTHKSVLCIETRGSGNRTIICVPRLKAFLAFFRHNLVRFERQKLHPKLAGGTRVFDLAQVVESHCSAQDPGKPNEQIMSQFDDSFFMFNWYQKGMIQDPTFLSAPVRKRSLRLAACSSSATHVAAPPWSWPRCPPPGRWPRACPPRSPLRCPRSGPPEDCCCCGQRVGAENQLQPTNKPSNKPSKEPFFSNMKLIFWRCACCKKQFDRKDGLLNYWHLLTLLTWFHCTQLVACEPDS